MHNVCVHVYVGVFVLSFCLNCILSLTNTCCRHPIKPWLTHLSSQPPCSCSLHTGCYLIEESENFLAETLVKSISFLELRKPYPASQTAYFAKKVTHPRNFWKSLCFACFAPKKVDEKNLTQNVTKSQLIEVEVGSLILQANCQLQ
jgi:hypothetical protein